MPLRREEGEGKEFSLGMLCRCERRGGIGRVDVHRSMLCVFFICEREIVDV